MAESVSADMFTINAVFVPAALQLGPGMSDSGETAMERDDLFASVLVELGYIPSVDYLPIIFGGSPRRDCLGENAISGENATADC